LHPKSISHRSSPLTNNVSKVYESCLPAPMFSRNDVSIWSILKKCIGMGFLYF
uniref:Uncharacterized protein n=1 Tax=Astyanax mexicanus TaxID=7994 RepID=A0A8B9LJL3_ASTMX